MDCVQVVESLSQKEKNSILHVLQRDEKLRVGQENKIRLLKEEIRTIRVKGILRAGDDQSRMCVRCRSEFGFLFNRGALCSVCHFKICKLCQEVMFNGSWLCKLCYKQRQLKWLTGEWLTFDENPLRKWASGSDLVKGSFQIFTGASSQDIDIDELPSQTSNNNHSKQAGQAARNGHLGQPEAGTAKERVEYPKDADQNRLSHLFDVLRTNRPDHESSNKLQVKRVSSRRYSESDSDSSTSSDHEETSNRGSPLAPSVTESEHDARRGDSPRGIDSPHGPDSPRKLSSVSEERDDNIDLSKAVRPKPAPRSPKPTEKTFAHDTQSAPNPRPREKRKHVSSPNVSQESRLKSEHISQVSASRSVDNILGHTLAPEKNRRNKKALSHTELHTESVERGLGDRSLESLRGNTHKSSEHLGSINTAEKNSFDSQMRRSADNVNTHSKSDQNTHENYKHLGAKVRQDIDAERRQSDEWLTPSFKDGDIKVRRSSDKKHVEITETSQESKQPHKDKDEDFELHVPRAGSPYSCSMDSIPSSHPSPIHSPCDSSLLESSDTDSTSRLSHTEVGELSGTESVQRDGSEDDYVVEEISKIRFQRVSKKVGQIAMVGKVNRSPRKHASFDGLEVVQRKTQSREVAGANEEGGGNRGNCQRVVESSTPQPLPDPIVEVVTPWSSPLSLSKGQLEQLNDSESANNQTSASKNIPSPEVWDSLKPLGINLVRLNSNMSNRSAEELSWYEEYGENSQTNIGDAEMQEYIKQRLVSEDRCRNTSDADSIEGMIDNMAQSQLYVEDVIHSARVSEADSEGGFSIPPLSPESYEVKAGTYTFTYMSDDNLDTYTTDENLDAVSGDSDQSGSDLDDTLLGQSLTDEDGSSSKIVDTVFRAETENQDNVKHKLKAMGSLDLLVMEQGDLVDDNMKSVELEQELEAAIKINEQIRESRLEACSSNSGHDSHKKLTRINTLDTLLDQQKLEPGFKEYVEYSKSDVAYKTEHFSDKLPLKIEREISTTLKLEPDITDDVVKQLDSVSQGSIVEQSKVGVKKSEDSKLKLSAMKSLDILVYEQCDPKVDTVELDMEVQTAFQEHCKVKQSREECSIQSNSELPLVKCEAKIPSESKLSRMDTFDMFIHQQGTLVPQANNMKLNNESIFNDETDSKRTGDDRKIPVYNTTEQLHDTIIPVEIESPVCQTVRSERNVKDYVAKCVDRLHNKQDVTRKHIDVSVADNGTLKSATKNKLTSMKSLDLLVYQQGDIIDPSIDNVELDIELQSALREEDTGTDGTESNHDLKSDSSFSRPKLCRMNTLDILLDKQGHIVSTSCDGKTSTANEQHIDKKEPPIERKPTTCHTAKQEQSLDHSPAKCVSELDIVETKIKTNNSFDESSVKKHHLSAMTSLDLLVYEQGDNLDANVDQVELDMEFRAADKVLSSECSTEHIVESDDNIASTEVKHVIGYVLQQESDDSDILSVIDEVEEESDNAYDSSQLESKMEQGNVVDNHTKNAIHSSDISGKETETIRADYPDMETVIRHTETSNIDNKENVLDDSELPPPSLSSRVKVIEQKVKHILSGDDNPSPGHAVHKGYDVKVHSKFKKLQNHWTAVEKHEANILDVDDGEQNNKNDGGSTAMEHPNIDSSKETGDTNDDTDNSQIKSQLRDIRGRAHIKNTTFSKGTLMKEADSGHATEDKSRSASNSVSVGTDVQHNHDDGSISSLEPSATPSNIRTGTYKIDDGSPDSHSADIGNDTSTSQVTETALDDSRICHSISDLSVLCSGSMMEEQSVCHSISNMSSLIQDTIEVFEDKHVCTLETASLIDDKKPDTNLYLQEHALSGQSIEDDNDDHNTRTAGHQSLPPLSPEQTECFKAPLVPHHPDRRGSGSSVDSSPEIGYGPPFPNMESPRSEKFSSRSSPQTISESSQDDSGLVSGGSWGTATPEHRRTDSGYSQSSLPSTMSTVTDKSEDEDIDRMFACAPLPSRSNLLSVFSDSRESIASYYSDAGDIAYSKIPVSGEILFGLNYNYKTGMLEVGLKQCRNIAAADTKRNRSDPYVKTYLLPDRTRSGKRKTKVKKHTLNPTFDETLKYVISKSELENRTLWVTVWNNDRFGRNDFLGEVTINFDYYKFDEPFPKWYPLQERLEAQPTSMMTYKGDLSLSICYVPPEKVAGSPTRSKGSKGPGRGQLHVKLKEARNLTAVRSNGFSDPFCKGYLLPERHRSSKQKTAVMKKDCSPTWNHTFVFEDVALIELRERCLELTIWDYEKLSSNDFLGGTRLNLGTGLSQGKPVEWMDARGEEMSIWQAMLDRPNIWIDGALVLRPNMEKRKF